MKTLGQIGNIKAAVDRETAGNQISYLVWLYLMSDVVRENYKVNENTREIANISMKNGKYPIFMEVIAGTPEDKSTGEGGDITSAVTNTFAYVVGGNRVNQLDFLENFIGAYFLVAYQNCSTTEQRILGTPCQPMRLKGFERVNGKESQSISLTFENKSFIQPYIFTGTHTQEPSVTLPAAATDLGVSTKTQYEIAEGNGSSAANISTVSGITDAMVGKVITLKGSGGSNPSVLKNGDPFLLNGDWTANAGATISLRIFDASHLVEVGRSE